MMEKLKRPGPWQRDELILALDLYFKKSGKVNETDPDTILLAQQLNVLNRLRDGDKAALRNPNSVDMKVWNFHRFDKKYMASGRKALRNGSKLDAIIWNEFSHDLFRLTETSNAIKAQLISSKVNQHNILPEVDSDAVEASEGALLTRVHLYRERNKKLVRLKKEKSLEKHGALRCEICNFNYEETYGTRGQGFIECHHLKPLNSYTEKDTTKLEDLALVCANCHRMIHSQRPWLTIQDLKTMLKLNKV